MNNEIVPINFENLETNYNRVCKPYGVSCKVVSKSKYVFSKEKDNYLVFSTKDIPMDLNVKDVYIRNERSNWLFYTDYFVVKLDENSSPLGLVEAAVSYCKTVEFLKKLFSEFKTPLPTVIREDEIGALKEYNRGRNNTSIPASARSKYNKGLKKFFKQERTRSKFLQKWRAFSRTDKYDRKASFWKMLRDFRKRKSQITEHRLLHETNDDLKTALINEHEFDKFKVDMQRLFPDVLYGVSEREVQNEGFDLKRNKRKPIDKIDSGPFGKLVTYAAYCEEREKKFATMGFDAISNLNPAYYETRQLTYKEIDEPFIASVLNTIRFAYAKSDNLHDVRNPELDIVSFVDVPVGDMMNFVSLTKSNHVPFYLDCFGKFGRANLETIRVVYNPADNVMMKSIVHRMIDEKFTLSHINTTLDSSSVSLDKKIYQANCLQLRESSVDSLLQETTLEL